MGFCTNGHALIQGEAYCGECGARSAIVSVATASVAPAGWYEDPHVPGQLRYFDSVNWTENIRPAVAPVYAPPPTGMPVSAVEVDSFKVSSEEEAPAFTMPPNHASPSLTTGVSGPPGMVYSTAYAAVWDAPLSPLDLRTRLASWLMVPELGADEGVSTILVDRIPLRVRYRFSTVDDGSARLSLIPEVPHRLPALTTALATELGTTLPGSSGSSFSSENNRSGGQHGSVTTSAEADEPLKPVDSWPAWLIAFIPLLALAIAIGFADGNPVIAYNSGWIALLLNIGITVWDNSRLKSAGYPSLMGWAVFLIPVYLYKRQKTTGQPIAPWLVWVGAFALSWASIAILPGLVGVPIDQGKVESGITSWVADKTGIPVSSIRTSCPNPAAKPGETFLCTVTGGGETANVQVTVENSNGDVTWQAIG